jgi:hypothetical protein
VRSRRISRSESLRGYTDGKVLQLRKVKRFGDVGNYGRLGRSKICRRQIGRQMYEDREARKLSEVWEVTKFGRSGSLDRLGGWKRRQDSLACTKSILANSC